MTGEPTGNTGGSQPKDTPKADYENALPDGAEAVLAEMTANVPTDTVLQVVEDVLNNTDDTVRPFRELADKHGLDPETIHQQISHVRQSFTKQTQAAISGHGVDPGEVIQFAREFYSTDQLREWQRDHYIKGDMRYVSKIVDAFKLRRGLP